MKANYDAHWTDATMRLQSTMKAWRDSHPQATFVEIEDALEAELAKLRAELLSDLATASAAADGETESGGRVVCPHCGKASQKHGKRKRDLKAAGNQVVELTRTVMTCPECGQAFFPSGQ